MKRRKIKVIHPYITEDGKGACFFSNYVNSKCHNCRGEAEQGEEAVYVPKGETGQRFFHKGCVTVKANPAWTEEKTPA